MDAQHEFTELPGVLGNSVNSATDQQEIPMLKSLATAVTTANLNTMLATIEKLPSAVITRGEKVITVHATKKATGETVKVLSAITADGNQWSVQAVPGLVTVA